MSAESPFAQSSSSSRDSGARERERPPLLADRFELRGLLGVGGMGSVYRAHDLELDEPIALKLLRRELLHQPGTLDRFRREVKLARKVTHPCVARTFDIGSHLDDRFITMELIEGESLANLLERTARLPLERVLDVARAVCDGLGAAHAVGVVHRDLKPDNVLLARDGRIALTDFGIARACEPTVGPMQTSGLAVGTPEYMAPEQLDTRATIDGRADVYALGVMLYEMVVGERPWHGDSPFAIAAARLVSPPPDPRAKAEVPDALARVILRCMARAPDGRYARTAEVAAALGGLTLPAGPVRGNPALLETMPPPRPIGAARKSVLFVALRPAGHADALRLGPALADLSAELLAACPGATVCLGAAGRDDDPREAARARGAQVVVHGTLHVAETRLSAAVRVVNVVDELVLADRHLVVPRAQPFALASLIAAAVGDALLLPRPKSLPAFPAHPGAAEAYLHARAEARSDDPLGNDRAIALFERAISLAPRDPWVNAAYARAMLHRYLVEDAPVSDLFEARDMARRCVEVAPAMVGAQEVLAHVAFELGDDLTAASALRRATLLAPASAELLALEARLRVALGDVDGGQLRIHRAQALAPTHPSIAWDAASIEALRGGATASVPPTTATASALGLLAASRLALWRANPTVARALLAEVTPRVFVRKTLVVALLQAGAFGSFDEAIAEATALAEHFADAPRRASRHRALVVELLAVSGRRVEALNALEALGEGGAVDLGWLDRAPPLASLRDADTFARVRRAADAAAAPARRALFAPAETLGFDDPAP